MFNKQPASLPLSVSGISIEIRQLPHGQDLPLPKYETALSAGMDLLAAIPEPIILEPKKWEVIPSGVAIALPTGFEAQIRSRSGLALNHGVVILNSPGTIDADYRGELKGILINHGREPFTVMPGMRFAQLVVAPIVHAEWKKVDKLSSTDRGLKGFGSTGING